MAINIKVYKDDSLEQFSKDFAEESKLETGSLNAFTACMAASLLKRVALNTSASERQEYILRNSEILRNYFIHLVDDDLKARNGYNKEVKNGDKYKIEAAIHPAVTINEEVISMCMQMMQLGLELKSLTDEINYHYLKEMAELSLGAVKSCISWILYLTSKCEDETYKFVVKRENEITLNEINEIYGKY